MKIIFRQKSFLLGAISLLLLLNISSCTNSSDRLQEKVVRLVGNSKHIVAFGKINANSIIEKGELKEIPKFGVILSTYLGQIENSINMDSPVFFTAEGPLDINGTPSRVNLFLDVIDKDSLRAAILRQGLDMDDAKDVSYVSESDVTVAIKNDIVLLSISSKGNLDVVALNQLFARMENGILNDKISEIMDGDGDVVSGVHLENLYQTANTSLNRSENSSKKVLELVKDSYVGMDVFFEDGELRISEKNYFSQKLTSLMFLEDNTQSKENIQDLIGAGNAKVGLSLNMNLAKLQNWINFIDPQAYNEMKKGISFMLTSISPELATNDPNEILTGQIAAVLVGDNNQLEGLSDFNVFIGMHDKSVKILQKNKDIISAFVPNATITNNGISLLSTKNGKLVLPDYAEDFGTNGLDLFVDLEKLNLKELDLQEAENYIRLIKSISLKATNQDVEMIVSFKKDDNVLKQVKDRFIQDLQERIRIL